MKFQLILTSRILALALLAAAPCAFAQTSVPNSMSYQGRISDASGNLVGNPTPVNRTVIFRVWDSPSATAPANLLYSEQQIVTIASGEFNVLVGQGLQVGTEPKPAFDSVFNGLQRFLGVTVDDGTAAADPEITPRQQLVTSAFAFRAKTAEGVPPNAITSSMLAAGAVTPNSIAPSAIDSSKLAAGAVTTASIAANAINSTKLAPGTALANIAANSIDSTKLAAGAVTSASIAPNAVTAASIANGSISATKLDASVGLWSVNGADVFRGSGNVGIGTATPTEAKLVVSGSVTKASLTAGYLNPGGAFSAALFTNHDISIQTSHSIWAGGTVLSSSDERIKNIRGVSDGAADLETLVGIEITDYTHRDIVSKGGQPQKKVIAQQVEKVFPQAVDSHTGVVPDIYQRAEFKDSWVELETNLKVGERVKLIGAKTEGVHEVLEVKAGRFRTDFNSEGDLVFVYGREVKDFRTVDYDAISMLNVSATQQLKREKDAELKALREENAALRARLTASEAQDHARDARLAAIEKALRTSSGPVVPVAAARTVSVK